MWRLIVETWIVVGIVAFIAGLVILVVLIALWITRPRPR